MERLGQDCVAELREALARQDLIGAAKPHYVTADVEVRIVNPARLGHAERVRCDPLAESGEKRQSAADRGSEGANRWPWTFWMSSQRGGPRNVHVRVGSLDVQEGSVERCEPAIHPARRTRSGPAMTVGARMTSSTGASLKRRGRASVRGIGIRTYLVTRGEGALCMPQSSPQARPKSSDRRYEIDPTNGRNKAGQSTFVTATSAATAR
jgi:hypothetical protein